MDFNASCFCRPSTQNWVDFLNSPASGEDIDDLVGLGWQMETAKSARFHAIARSTSARASARFAASLSWVSICTTWPRASTSYCDGVSLPARAALASSDRAASAGQVSPSRFATVVLTPESGIPPILVDRVAFSLKVVGE